MGIDRKEIKYSAKLSISKQRKSVSWTTIVFLVLSVILGFLAIKVVRYDEISEFIVEHAGKYMAGSETEAEYVKAINSINWPGTYALILFIMLKLVNGVLSVGLCSYALNIARNKQVGVRNLFDSFYIFFKVVWLIIVQCILIMLWGLLFIIPGIIAAIRYSQAIFVLLDDPKKPVSQCINESKYLMNGNMGQYVVLHLSFIGWYLLFMFKNNVISALIYAAFGSYVLNSYELSVYLVLGIGLVIIYVFQKPYVTVTCANFYRRLINESMNGIDSEQEPKNQGPWKI